METHTTARILIVDDIKENIDLLEFILSESGYTNIIGITEPRDTVELYRSFAPDIVLLDLNMPHLNGFQVMKQLKSEDTSGYVPILVLTASQDSENKLKALDSGANDYLSKPFIKDEVLLRIRNLVEVRLLHKTVISQNELLAQQNLTLEEKVRERTQELHDTRLEIIHRLSLAAEYRDNETGFHIIRMSQMCRVLALSYGMSITEADVILNASPMHDVGKIGIPDRVLLKPDKLNQEEWELMKTHTTIGGRILGDHPSRLLAKAAEIALSHHEKWDGTGYPLGLKGEEIPLSGRISAVADVFDALTSRRPYKKAWSIEEAITEIVGLRGTHFDPELVDHMQKSLDQIVAIKQQYQESAETDQDALIR